MTCFPIGKTKYEPGGHDNMGCRVSKGGIYKSERCLAKNQYSRKSFQKVQKVHKIQQFPFGILIFNKKKTI